GGERLRARGPLRIVAEQLPVTFHRRPAAGGVDDDDVHGVVAGTFESLDQLAREVPGVLIAARMQRERAAAALRARGQDVAALGGEYPDRRVVHVAEEHLLDAAGEEADRETRRARGGRALRHVAGRARVPRVR